MIDTDTINELRIWHENAAMALRKLKEVRRELRDTKLFLGAVIMAAGGRVAVSESLLVDAPDIEVQALRSPESYGTVVQAVIRPRPQRG